MKSSVSVKTLSCAALVSLLVLTGCKSERAPLGGEASASSEWKRSPTIESASWSGSQVALVGLSEPNGRVVLSNDSGLVYAANADKEGRFDIEIPVPVGGIALKLRSQMGQTFIDGQGLLYLVPGPSAVAVTVLDGEASHRVGGRGALDSVDTDGVVLILSGHVAARAIPHVQVGTETFSPETDSEGRWIVATTGGAGSVRIAVGGRVYDFPGVGKSESAPAVVGSGWLLTRNLGGKAVQTTWLPVDM